MRHAAFRRNGGMRNGIGSTLLIDIRECNSELRNRRQIRFPETSNGLLNEEENNHNNDHDFQNARLNPSH